jgi:hypothetical protein
LSAGEAMHHAVQIILDKIRVEISDCFSHLWALASRFGFLGITEFLVNHEQLTELWNKHADLSQQY